MDDRREGHCLVRLAITQFFVCSHSSLPLRSGIESHADLLSKAQQFGHLTEEFRGLYMLDLFGDVVDLLPAKALLLTRYISVSRCLRMIRAPPSSPFP